MTVGEAFRACDAYRKRRRDDAYFAYTNAMTVGLFVGSMFGGRQPPKIEDIYPEFFPKQDLEEIQAIEEEKRIERSAANFIAFANAFNRKFENNGNRESESQDNG